MFAGIGIGSDVFMSSIEVITAMKTESNWHILGCAQWLLARGVGGGMAIRASSCRHRGCSVASHAIVMVVAVAIAAVAAVAVDVVSVRLGLRRCRCCRRGLAALGGVGRLHRCAVWCRVSRDSSRSGRTIGVANLHAHVRL